MFLSKYGVARNIYIPIIKRAVVDFAVSADWTPAAGDVKVSKDGGAAANITTLPTAITMGNTAIWLFPLSLTEMQAAQIVVTVSDSATKAVEDQSFIIETHGHASAQFQVDLADSVRAGLTALPNATVSGVGGLLTAPTTANVGLADLSRILGTALTETAGQIAAAFKQFFDVGTPTGTMKAITNVVTTTTATNVTTVNGLAAGVITAASIATGAIDADALAADAVAEIADGVWDEDATGHQTQGTFGQAIGDPVADTNTIYKAVVTDATGATVGVDVVAVKAETVSILADTAEIGAAGAGLTAINLPNQTMDIVGNITGNLSGSVGSVTGAVGSVAAGGITAASIATGAIDADAIAADAANEIADALLDRTAGVETGVTPRQWFRLAAAALFGKASGMSTTTAVFRDTTDTTNRITATVDASGNRSSVTLDPS